MKVVLELIFERQIVLNGENGVRVGKYIPYHGKSKCEVPMVGGNKVRSGNRKLTDVPEWRRKAPEMAQSEAENESKIPTLLYGERTSAHILGL